MGNAPVVDCDQHLYESRDLWRSHIDPADRHRALAIEDDDQGYAWLTWQGRRLQLADVQQPGDTAVLGDFRAGQRRGDPPPYVYDDALPRDYWDPAARRDRLDEMGLDGAVLFPNFGLLWERPLSDDLPALTANMRAWNRWCAIGGGRGGRTAVTGRPPDAARPRLARGRARVPRARPACASR